MPSPSVNSGPTTLTGTWLLDYQVVTEMSGSVRQCVKEHRESQGMQGLRSCDELPTGGRNAAQTISVIA